MLRHPFVMSQHFLLHMQETPTENKTPSAPHEADGVILFKHLA